MDDSIKTLPSVSRFKKHINDFIRPIGKSFYGIRDKTGIDLLTKIRVDFSYLSDHRYNHNFFCHSPICFCGIEDETPVHYFLCCPRFASQRTILLSKISEIVASDISVLPKDHIVQLILYGSNVFNSIANKLILEQSITFIKKSGRFNKLEAFW